MNNPASYQIVKVSDEDFNNIRENGNTQCLPLPMRKSFEYSRKVFIFNKHNEFLCISNRDGICSHFDKFPFTSFLQHIN